MVIRMELFLEVYHAFVFAGEERKALPEYEEIRDMIYWFASDYSETMLEKACAPPLTGKKILLLK